MNVKKKFLCLIALFAWLAPVIMSNGNEIVAQNSAIQQKKGSVSGVQ
jgi:hypothetical protein